MMAMNRIAILLTLILLLGFYIRLQTIFPTNAGVYLYEFDPFYYARITQFIVADGAVPQWDSLAWHPIPSTHKTDPPLTNYLSALLYFSIAGQTLDVHTLYLANAIFPPIFATLAALCAFFLICETTHSKEAGLIAAAIIALSPYLIEKTAAGMHELTPFGIFGLLFFFMAYARALNRQTTTNALLAGAALSILIFGAKLEFLAYVVLAGYMCLQGTIDYLRGIQLSKSLLKTNTLVVGMGAFSSLLLHIGYSQLPGLPLGAIILPAALTYFLVLTVLSESKEKARRNLIAILLLGTCLLFTLLIIFSQFSTGKFLLERVSYIAGENAPHDMVSNIISEESRPSANDFIDTMGYVGLPFSALYWLDARIFILMVLTTAIFLSWRKNSKWVIFYALILLPPLWGALGKIKFITLLLPCVILVLCAILGSMEEKIRRILFLLGLLLIALLLINLIPILVISLSQADCSQISAKEDIFSRQMPLKYYLYCHKIPADWIATLNWIRTETPSDARFAAWADYGHWINYLGQRAVITRNDHVSIQLDAKIAKLFIENSSMQAKSIMNEHEASYLLIDKKMADVWGALVYIYCVNENKTQFLPGQLDGSECETDYELWGKKANQSVWAQGALNGKLDGFTLVFTSENEAIKVFKIEEIEG